MREDEVTFRIIGCAMTVHRALGPGLLESAYQNSLDYEFRREKLKIESQKELPLIYNGVRTKKGYRIDFLVENRVVVEVKAVKQITLLDQAQMQTYLRLSNVKIGLILNFNTRWLKNGIYRVLNPLCVENK
jgi:GxxExxY protein